MTITKAITKQGNALHMETRQGYKIKTLQKIKETIRHNQKQKIYDNNQNAWTT